MSEVDLYALEAKFNETKAEYAKFTSSNVQSNEENSHFFTETTRNVESVRTTGTRPRPVGDRIGAERRLEYTWGYESRILACMGLKCSDPLFFDYEYQIK